MKTGLLFDLLHSTLCLQMGEYELSKALPLTPDTPPRLFQKKHLVYGREAPRPHPVEVNPGR